MGWLNLSTSLVEVEVVLGLGLELLKVQVAAIEEDALVQVPPASSFSVSWVWLSQLGSASGT